MSNKIDGKLIATDIKAKLKEEVLQMNIKPILAVILVGDDAASQVYVRNKHKACDEVGINSIQINLPKDVAEDVLISKINELNEDNSVHGILVQLPLPKHIDVNNVIAAIDPRKDVDGFTLNSQFVPCTPAGVIELLDNCTLKGINTLNGTINYTLEGMTALVIGRSDIVGKPVAKLLLERNCTVMQAHSKTPKDILFKMFSFADIVVSAVGKTDIISEYDVEDYFRDNKHDFYGDFSNKRDRIIIDVGINRDENGKLCGDFSEAFKEKYSSFYTPVPGGVGPMTIAMLLKNTVLSEKLIKY